MEILQRVSILETKEEQTDKRVGEHDILIKTMDTKLSTLVAEVKQIRNALYFLAVCVAANIPALQGLPTKILSFFH